MPTDWEERYRTGETPWDKSAPHPSLVTFLKSEPIRGRVLVRRNDPATWMEIYENVAVPAQFESTLTAAVERHGVAAFAHDGARHLEAFVAFD